MAKKTARPVHPLAMVEALTEINQRVGTLLVTISAVQGAAGHMSPDQLKGGLDQIAESADALRTFIWPDD